MPIKCIVIFLCALGLIGVTAELHVYLEDVVIEFLDPEYYDVENTEMYIVESSTGENTITAHLIVVKLIPPDAEVRFHLLGSSLGKYTDPTGIDLIMDLCEMMDEPIILGPFFAVFGLNADDCPPKPGTYHQEGYTLPMENFPDDFIENRYLARFEITIHGKPIALFNIYIDIQM